MCTQFWLKNLKERLETVIPGLVQHRIFNGIGHAVLGFGMSYKSRFCGLFQGRKLV